MSSIPGDLRPPAVRSRDARADRPSETAPHLLHYLRVIVKRRWTALATLGAVILAVAFVTARSVPTYQARAQLMIEVERPQVIVFADDEKGERSEDSRDYQETQRRILQSRVLASRALEDIGLWQHPEFGAGPKRDQSRIEARLEAIGTWLESLPGRLAKSPNYDHGVLLRPKGPDPDEALGFEERREHSAAIDAFLSRLDVVAVAGSRLVDVSFRSTDPKLAAAVANGLTEAYIEQNREFKATVAKESADWLANQLEEHRKQLRQSQDALQKYREQRPDASGGEGADLVLRRLEGLNATLMSARTDRMQKEALFNQVQATRGNQNALENLQTVQSAPSVQAYKKELAQFEQQDLQLRQKFGERHPERAKLLLAIQTTQGRLAEEIRGVVERVRSDYQAAQEQEATLVRAVESQKREAMAASGKRAEYENLARAASTDQEIFGTLLQRAKKTGVTTGLVASNIRVVDPASVPQVPVTPNVRRNLLMALIGGMLLAISLVFFLEYMDKSITSPEQIRADLGLTCLGLVPVIKGWHEKGIPLLNNGVPAAFQEAFRSVRTSVLFSSQGEPVHTILVTSTGPNEGKTLVASNLALSLAQTGQRVLLLDADLRRPRVHHVFQQPQAPGLSELTTGRVAPSRAIVRTSTPGLWILPSGTAPSNPSELLSSEMFRRVITELSHFFSWLIIDSPPVLAVTDAALLAHASAGVLFVVAAEVSRGPAAMNALDQLDTAQARFLGAVLNKVDFKRNAFYYSDYYRREYADYYTSSVADAGRSVASGS